MGPFLFITGMHRSGTSLLTRALNLSGVYLGELDSLVSHDWIYHEDNKRGHWEDKKIIELADKTLSLSNSTWDEVKDNIIDNDQIGLEISKRIKELSDHPALLSGFKDPRLLLCFEAWQKYLPENFIIVGIFRDPLKVCESLKNRNNFSYDKSLTLWKLYNQKLIELLEKHNGFLLDFDWPKEKLLSEIKLIASKLGLSTKIDLDQWYTPELYHADNTYKKEFNVSDDIKDLYSKLKTRAELNKSSKIKVTHSDAVLSEVISELLSDIQIQGIYFKKITDNNLPGIHTLESSIKEKDSQLANLQSSIKEKDSQLANLQSSIKEKDYQLASIKITIQQQQNHIENLQETINKIQNDLEKIHQSFTWKTLRKYDKIIGKLRTKN